MVLCKACPAYLELKNAGIEQLPHIGKSLNNGRTDLIVGVEMVE